MADVTTVPIGLISAEPGHNHRSRFPEDELRQLADNIAKYGLAQPPTVRPAGDGYYLVCGERRFRAIELLGWERVPVMIRDLDDTAAYGVMLAENLARTDVDPMDEAEGYRAGLERGFEIDQIADMAGVKPSQVTRRLSLLDLVDDLAAMLRSGALSTGHFESVARLDRNRQIVAMRLLQGDDRLQNWWAFDKLCDKLLGEQNRDGVFDPDAFAMVAEEFVLEAVKKAHVLPRDMAALLAEMADQIEMLALGRLDPEQARMVEVARLARSQYSGKVGRTPKKKEAAGGGEEAAA